MATPVQCPYCGSYSTEKTNIGKFTNNLSKVGSVVCGAMLQMATGIPGILGVNLGYGQTWHQYCCYDCHNVFKVQFGAAGYIKKIKKYEE